MRNRDGAMSIDQQASAVQIKKAYQRSVVGILKIASITFLQPVVQSTSTGTKITSGVAVLRSSHR